MERAKPNHEVWAQFLLSRSDEDRIRAFFVSECGIPPGRVARKMHLTVYYARRPLPGLTSSVESANLRVPVTDTRFMVMAPGGENPRPELEPALRKVGIRVRRGTEAMSDIIRYRGRLLVAETPKVLGARKPSDRRRNAFGARHFQPHMTLLRPGSGVNRDLNQLGKLFRSVLVELTFDAFAVDVVRRTGFRPPPNHAVHPTGAGGILRAGG